MEKICIIGAGTWGTALARMLYNSGHDVSVWSVSREGLVHLAETGRHRNLPGVEIPRGICFEPELRAACEGREIVVFAVPSVYMRSVARLAAGAVRPGAIAVSVSKGIEPETLMTMSEVLESEIPHIRAAALSGPTHAEEVARDLPSTIVSACGDLAVAERVQAAFSNDVMRVYTNTDIKGVELCGALKNIIALAAGISAGLGYGDNTKAALITRGLAEMTRLGEKMGCLPETFSGLAGMGDLIVTATSRHSRNGHCGYLIGQGNTPDEAVKKVGMVVEGIYALPAAMALSEKYGVEMPVIHAVNRIVNENSAPKDAVRELMGRKSKTELPRPISAY